MSERDQAADQASDRDATLDKVLKQLEGDFRPVRPWTSPSRQALFLLALAVPLLLTGILLFFKLNTGAVGGLLTIGLVVLAQAATSALLATAMFREATPAQRIPTSALLILASGALAIQTLLNQPMQWISPFEPEAGRGIPAGISCFLRVLLFSGIPLGIALWMMWRGLLTSAARLGVLLGLGAWLLAEGAWKLHCPYTNWSHMLGAHMLVAVVTAAVAMGAIWLRRQGDSSPSG